MINSLNYDEVKKEISKFTGYKIGLIKLFGSRINGNFIENSDLDVAIIDKTKCDFNKMIEKIELLNLIIEIHYVEDFNHSWLINAV